MTPEQINRAIAEHCGWHHFISNDEYGNARALRPYEEAKTGCVFTDIPNYNGDLNAMHEAEKTLEPKQKWEFSLRLVTAQENSMLTKPEDWATLLDHKFKAPGFFPAVFATAVQRAEAFLRTVNKWKE